MNNTCPLFVASHGGRRDNEVLNDLCNVFGAKVHRIQVSDAGKTITPAEIESGLVDNAFVIVGLCEEGMDPSSKIQTAERNILLAAHDRKLSYAIFCRRIAYALSSHLLDASDICMILTTETPNEQQIATLRRAFPKAGDPIEVRIPRTDALKVIARMSGFPSMAA